MSESMLRTDNIPSIFWGMMILMVGLSMTYLALYGHIHDVSAALDSGLIMLSFLTFAVILTAGEIIYAEKNILESAQAFTAGLIVWFLLAFSSQSMSKINAFIPYMDITGLEEIAGGFWVFYLPNFINPVVEEMLWAVGLPVFLVLMMEGLASSSRVVKSPLVRRILGSFGNIVVQLGVLMTVLPLSFAFFHIDQQASMIFILSAVTFRAILTAIWWGDLQFDLVPFLVILPSFLVGSHIGNNMGVTARNEGIMYIFNMMMSHPIGMMTSAIMGFLFFIAALGVVEDVKIVKEFF